MRMRWGRSVRDLESARTGRYFPAYGGLVEPSDRVQPHRSRSVGSTLAHGGSGSINIGERSAIRLAFIGGGAAVVGASAERHNTPAVRCR